MNEEKIGSESEEYHSYTISKSDKFFSLGKYNYHKIEALQ